MKKKILTAITTWLLACTAWAQEVPYVVSPAGVEYELRLMNSGSFASGQYGSASNQTAYQPYCSGMGWANFRVYFPNPDRGKDIRYYIQVNRVYFNPANGTPYYSASTGAVTVYTTPEVEDNNNNSIMIEDLPSILVEDNAYYFVTVKSKHKVLGIWQANWADKRTNNLNFLQGQYNTTIVASLNTLSTVSMPSYYGPIDVEEFSPTTSLILNAGDSYCDDRYGIDVEEFNLNTWTAVSGTTRSTGWVMTQAPTAYNLTTFYTPGFAYGKVYHIRLYAGPKWAEKHFFVTRKAATLTASVNRQSYRTVTVFDRNTDLVAYYLVEKIAHCDAASMTVTPTYVTGYKVDIAQVSSTTMQVISGAWTSGWQTGVPPSPYNLSAAYTPLFGGGKIYKVLLSYGDPMQSKTFYIEFAACPRILAWDGDNGMDVEEAVAQADVEMEVLVFPNPGPGVFNLSFSTPVQGTVDVFDMNGRKVKQLGLNGQTTHQVDLTGYAKGIYVVHANVNGSQYIRKVILE